MFSEFANRDLVAYYDELGQETPTISGQIIDTYQITSLTEWEPAWPVGLDGMFASYQHDNTYRLKAQTDQHIHGRLSEAHGLYDLCRLGLAPLLGAAGIQAEMHRSPSGFETMLVRYPNPYVFEYNTRQMRQTDALRPPVTFTVYEGGEYPWELFIDRFGNNREVLTARDGWHSRHDVIAHDVAWLALTEGMVSTMQGKAKAIYDMPSGEAREQALDTFMKHLDTGVFRPRIVKILENNPEWKPDYYAKDLAALTDRSTQQVIEELGAHAQIIAAKHPH
jgi:hypothetical protein